ncbi:MarR family transcriptional regulator [Clostridioides sp. ES-S-0108-01]|uniref:MarR family winged helix-turn-helix transcriptional regulator n=1 Tax=Clostridioides sp. ES-S-0108-01 TaxID=2770773 RepID=UPI001D0CD988
MLIATQSLQLIKKRNELQHIEIRSILCYLLCSKFIIISSSESFISLLILLCITQDTIFKKILVNPSNITRALANLEKEGFITRKPSVKEKRTWHLYPTEKSLECYDEILRITNGYVEELLSSFEKEEKELFISMLEKVAFLAIDKYIKLIFIN